MQAGGGNILLDIPALLAGTPGPVKHALRRGLGLWKKLDFPQCCLKKFFRLTLSRQTVILRIDQIVFCQSFGKGRWAA